MLCNMRRLLIRASVYGNRLHFSIYLREYWRGKVRKHFLLAVTLRILYVSGRVIHAEQIFIFDLMVKYKH